MGFKSLFIVSDKKNGSDEKQVTQAPATPSVAPAPVPYIPTAAQTNEDFSMFAEQLRSALDDANMPNVQDYMDLKQAVKNMDGIAMDESTKYKAVFATLQASGCDLKALVESFDYYGNIVDGEKQKFDEAIQSAVSDAVLDKQRKVESLTKENEEKAADIKRLTEEINANQQQITTLSVEVSTANSKIEQKKANFTAAYQQLKNEMEADRKKVELYVGAIPVATPKLKKSSKK
jgi:chromosome segregation ATPase